MASIDEAEIRDGAAPLGSTVTEAANRAEVTALLIRCGCRVYRSEADIDGEDLVMRTPVGDLRLVQLKGRPTVEWKRYGGRELWMLFPSAPWRPHAAWGVDSRAPRSVLRVGEGASRPHAEVG